MLQRHFKRVRREEKQPTIRMSLLEDSHTSHKTKRVAMLCKSLNVQLAIIGGGLTGDIGFSLRDSNRFTGINFWG